MAMPVLVSGSPSFQGHARPPASGWRHRTARADSGFFAEELFELLVARDLTYTL